MNPGPIIVALEKRFPGRPVQVIPPDAYTPREIIVEVERKQQPNYSKALAVIERSAPHYHHHTQEVYVVERGHIRVHLNDTVKELHAGEELIIPPGTTHWVEAVGEPAWVNITATPAWEQTDHIFV